MKLIGLLVLFILIVILMRPVDGNVQSHLVYVVNGDKAIGSGIIVADGWVMTCAHLVPKNKKVQVYSKPEIFNKHNQMAQVIYINKDRDVALLKVPWVKGYVTFGNAYIDEEVVEVGYTNGQEFIFHGRVCRMDTGIFEIDMNASFGASGSGVYDVKTGELVGMVSYIRILGPVGSPTVIGVIPSSLLSIFMEYTNPRLYGE